MYPSLWLAVSVSTTMLCCSFHYALSKLYKSLPQQGPSRFRYGAPFSQRTLNRPGRVGTCTFHSQRSPVICIFMHLFALYHRLWFYLPGMPSRALSFGKSIPSMLMHVSRPSLCVDCVTLHNRNPACEYVLWLVHAKVG
jgi:hypothetical protein